MIHGLQSIVWCLVWTVTIWLTINAVCANIRCFKTENMTYDQLREVAKSSILLDVLSSIFWAVLIVFWWN